LVFSKSVYVFSICYAFRLLGKCRRKVKRRGVEALCSGAYAEKQKKTVRFRKTAAARDGTPEVKRASHEGAAGSEKPITAAQETTVRRRRTKPAGAGAYESRNPHYNEAVPSAAQFSGG